MPEDAILLSVSLSTLLFGPTEPMETKCHFGRIRAADARNWPLYCT
jgi:hypothetical protein